MKRVIWARSFYLNKWDLNAERCNFLCVVNRNFYLNKWDLNTVTEQINESLERLLSEQVGFKPATATVELPQNLAFI